MPTYQAQLTVEVEAPNEHAAVLKVVELATQLPKDTVKTICDVDVVPQYTSSPRA